MSDIDEATDANNTNLDVAQRLRDKIRLQATELLLKADEKQSNAASRRSSATTNEPSDEVNESSSSTTNATNANATNTTNTNATTTKDPPSSSSFTTTNTNTNTNSSRTTANNTNTTTTTTTTTSELTKRLQTLALERQKTTAKDRLRVIQADPHSHLSSAKSFQELNLPSHLLDALFEMGFDRPSAIQEEALPRVLAGHNVIGQAQSGSGKTTCFTLGMLHALNLQSPTTQALCVTPTRELAIQIVEQAVAPMAARMEGLEIQLAIARAELSSQTKTVTAHLVVGTPGKVVDWMKRNQLVLSNLKVFVLDEADHMVSESGHRAKSLLICKKLPSRCQRLLFSATFPPAVVEFAEKLMTRPDKILLAAEPESLVLDVIKQLWIDVREYAAAPGSKLEFLADIYNLLTIGQSIVFVSTQKEANLVHSTLEDAGYTCSVLHAGVEADDRDTTMEQFRNGESNVLITTNVLARGVDVDNVCLVVNYTVPLTRDHSPDYETYLHRIGRTGRFGRKGTAITLIDDNQSMQSLAQIEQHFSSRDNVELIAKAPADPEALAEVIEI